MHEEDDVHIWIGQTKKERMMYMHAIIAMKI